jgi:hypothetical protein
MAGREMFCFVAPASRRRLLGRASSGKPAGETRRHKNVATFMSEKAFHVSGGFILCG